MRQKKGGRKRGEKFELAPLRLPPPSFFVKKGERGRGRAQLVESDLGVASRDHLSYCLGKRGGEGEDGRTDLFQPRRLADFCSLLPCAGKKKRKEGEGRLAGRNAFLDVGFLDHGRR